jgi:hypothetical protein
VIVDIKAHGDDGFARRFAPHQWQKTWKGRQPAGHSLDTCSYCGSLSPLALLDALKAGARLNPADWKYGWPHKFYVDGIPNEWAGQTVECGGRYDEKGYTPMMGEAPKHAYVKFYSEHLLDLPADQFEEIAGMIAMQTGTMFSVVDGSLHYRGRPPR